MFCEQCGNKLQDGAKFCDKCGAKVQGAMNAPGAQQEQAVRTANASGAQPERPAQAEAQTPSKPRKSKNREVEIKSEKPNFFLRIILLVVSAYLIWTAVGSIAVNFAGESETAYIESISNTGKKSNRGAGIYKWTVYYEFDVDDVTYSGYGFWHGTETTPALGLNQYHVGYLPAFPKINRLVKHDSVKGLIQEIKRANREGWEATDEKFEIVFVVVSTLVVAVIELFLGYMFLGMALPELPLPPIIREKKKKKKRAKKKKH